ncbi:deferrochelatase/peroxidase EfeB [Aneurinibacillus sp. BA2021]|nr:deferrochelatase/peroxidase EfeB [Aneurinibacillus sp. BA2021]
MATNKSSHHEKSAGEGMLEEKVSRRQMLQMMGIGGAGLLLGAGGMGFLSAKGAAGSTLFAASQKKENDILPFYGTYQQGITTTPQDFLHFAAFDVVAKQRDDVKKLLQIWTEAAARMSQGKTVGPETDHPYLPPTDTGEAIGLAPSRLTFTFGVSPTLFTQDGTDRFGLAGKRPAPLIDLPAFAGDDLQPEWCGGDIGVQVCANDPQVAFHAIRNLVRVARGLAVLRWSQTGFQRTERAAEEPGTPRNLMGFKDGTGNPNTEDQAEMNQTVWVQPGDQPSWMGNGSYMVVRRIRMRIEEWDRATLQDQEVTFGRYRHSGAPLGAAKEFDPLDLEKKNEKGEKAIPANAHVRLAHGDGKVKILRRSYSYTNGIDPKTGKIDAGLFFVAFQRDPRTQFVPMQRRLAGDALNEYIVHVGSAIFACLPGVPEGGYIGQHLF